MTMSTTPHDRGSESGELPGYDQIVYRARGPHHLRYGERDAVPASGPLSVGYERYGTSPRRWSIEIAVDRAYLLPLAQAKAIAVTPVEILAFSIAEPIVLTFAPCFDLAEELDTAENSGPLLSQATGLIEAQIRHRLLDLRRLEFVRARQGPGTTTP